MDQILPTPINEKKIMKAICIFMLAFCLAPIVLNIVCIAPLYTSLYSNIQFSRGPLPEIVRYVMDFLDILAFSSAYALIIFSFTFLRKKATVLISLSYVGVLLLKIPMKLVMEHIVNRSLTSASEIKINLLFAFFYFFIEILQFLAVFIIAATVSKGYLRALDILSSKKCNKKYKIKRLFPFGKYVDRSNPLLRAALYSSIVVIIFRILAQLVSDVELGAPESFKITMIIIITYIVSIIYGVVTYLLSILTFNLFYKFVSVKSDDSTENNALENETDETDVIEIAEIDDKSTELLVSDTVIEKELITDKKSKNKKRQSKRK